MAAGGNNICSSSNEKLSCSPELLESFWLPKSSSPSLQGPISMGNFENVGVGTTSAPSLQSLGKEENAYEDFDGCFFNPPGKKRRLTASQIQSLEKNFEVEDKLEPDRKVQLANEVGLQPRQVAIWFQNRRARSKNQRLEKDYDVLKAVYGKLRDDYDTLLKEKQDLQNEVVLLKDELLVRGKGKENLETLDAIELLEAAEPLKPITNIEACSDDGFYSDSPLYTEGNRSSLIDHADSSSQDEEDDNLSKGLLTPPYYLKLESFCYDDYPPSNSSGFFGLSMEDQPLWSWPY